MKKKYYLYSLILLIIFICSTHSINPTQIFQFSGDIVSTVHNLLTNNGTQLYVSCVLTDYSNVIRKYIIAGNSYFLKGTYQEPSQTFNYFRYDYIFVTNDYVLSGSKNGGYLRVWNKISFTYISELSIELFAKKIIYSKIEQKIIFIDQWTNNLKYFSLITLPTFIQVMGIYKADANAYTADGLELSPSQKYLVLYNQTIQTSTVISTNTFAQVGNVISNYLGQRSGCWSKNQDYYFQNTIVMDWTTYKSNSYVEVYYFHNVLFADIGLTILYHIYIVSISGNVNQLIYLDNSLQLVIPAKLNSNAESLIMSPVTYPALGRRLQFGLINYNLPIPNPFVYQFFFQPQKCYFSVIASNIMYFFSFYGKCLDNQYFDTNILTCINCGTGCLTCTYQVCLFCDTGYNMDNLTQQCIYNGPSPLNNNVTNNTSNTTTIYQSTNEQRQTFFLFLKDFYFNFLLKLLNKVPGSRKVLKPMFNFFVNLDDLWLYYYHKRSYCNTTLQMFQSIKIFQNQKWQTIHSNDILSFMDINEEAIEEELSYLNDISKNRDNFIKVQNRNNGYFVNTMDFYFSNLFLIVSVYLLMRIIFNLTKKSFISLYFRQYSFWIFLGIIIMQGNTQYFVYLITNQMQMLFNKIFGHKIFNLYALITFFVILVFSSVCYLMIYFNYEEKHSKYFFDNIKRSKKGSMYMISTFFIRNFILGFLHSYFNYDYCLKIFLLGTFQLAFILVFIGILIKKQVHNKFRQWILIICGFLRLVIVFTFYLDYSLQSSFTKLQHIQGTLFMVYLIAGCTCLLFDLIIFTYQLNLLLNKYFFNANHLLIQPNNHQKSQNLQIQQIRQARSIKNSIKPLRKKESMKFVAVNCQISTKKQDIYVQMPLKIQNVNISPQNKSINGTTKQKMKNKFLHVKRKIKNKSAKKTQFMVVKQNQIQIDQQEGLK